MKNTINLNTEHIGQPIPQEYIQKAIEASQKLINGKFSNWTGWLQLPLKTNKTAITEITDYIRSLKQKIDILLVIGIGGSYTGAKAIISALTDDFTPPKVIFAGYNLSEKQTYSIFNYLKNKNFGICVISKSGTTTEPAISFRIFRKLLIDKLGEQEANQRIIAITDPKDNALHNMARKNGYKLFFIPPDIGGRYSVLTPVGLVPTAFADIDIKQLINGATDMAQSIINNKDNIAIRYAAIRNFLYHKGYSVELLVSYTPYLRYFAQWWIQLFGESEGKENKGIFPSSVSFTTDLHSLGQFIQQGSKILFETVLNFTEKANYIEIPYQEDNSDNLNYLHGKHIAEVNKKAFLGTLKAHTDGGVPNIIIDIPDLNEYFLGQLIYFFEFSCATSGIMLGINPFDQPGVEFYKKNMFKLLGKPGF